MPPVKTILETMECHSGDYLSQLENVAKWTFYVSVYQKKKCCFSVLNTAVGRKGHQIILMTKKTMCYFLGNSWNKDQQRNIFISLISCCCNAMQTSVFLLCVPFLKRKKIVCQIIPVDVWISFKWTLLTGWRWHEFWNNELNLWSNRSSLSLFCTLEKFKWDFYFITWNLKKDLLLKLFKCLRGNGFKEFEWNLPGFFVNINVMKILLIMPWHCREGSKWQYFGSAETPACGSCITYVFSHAYNNGPRLKFICQHQLACQQLVRLIETHNFIILILPYKYYDMFYIFLQKKKSYVIAIS